MQYYTVHKRGKNDHAFTRAVRQAVTLDDAEDIASNLRAAGYTVSIVPIVVRWEEAEDEQDHDHA